MWIVTTNGLAVNLDHCAQVSISSNGYGQFELIASLENGTPVRIDNFKAEEEAVDCFYNIMKFMNDGVRTADIRKLRNPSADTSVNLPLRGLV